MPEFTVHICSFMVHKFDLFYFISLQKILRIWILSAFIEDFKIKLIFGELLVGICGICYLNH